jgi:ribosomal protein L6P/L9E
MVDKKNIIYRNIRKKVDYGVFYVGSRVLTVFGGTRQHRQSILILSNVFTFNKLLLSTSNVYFVLKRAAAKQLVSIFTLLFYSVKFGWIFQYSMVGYNFTFKNSRKKNLLKLSLGYSRHRIIICVPKSISFCAKGRRRLVFFGNVFQEFFKVYYYLFNLRNITPYKLRGVVLDNARSSLLKPGKKVKFR